MLQVLHPSHADPIFQLQSLNSEATGRQSLPTNHYHCFFVSDGFSIKPTGERNRLINIVITVTPYGRTIAQYQFVGQGYHLSFHPDFYCIYERNHETYAGSILFLDYGIKQTVALNDLAQPTFNLLRTLALEEGVTFPPHRPTLTALLHAVLIYVGRAKQSSDEKSRLPDLLQRFVQDVERNFRTDHRPRDYAERLHCTVQTLNRHSKEVLNRTATAFIRDRIMQQAKRELYLTGRSVAEIAFALGFTDPLYFSRWFTRAAGVSPNNYRSALGEDRGPHLV